MAAGDLLPPNLFVPTSTYARPKGLMHEKQHTPIQILPRMIMSEHV